VPRAELCLCPAAIEYPETLAQLMILRQFHDSGRQGFEIFGRGQEHVILGVKRLTD
jgi:hypothetical protein